MKKILCVCFSPAIQKTVFFENVKIGEVNRCEKYRLDAGGKAVNSARVLEQLEKGSSSLICPVGIKSEELFSSFLASDGINFSLVKISGSTRECVTLIDKNCTVTTELVLNEPNPNCDFSVYQQEFLSLVQKEICNCDALLISGSVGDCWAKEMPFLVGKIANTAKKLLFLDMCGAVLKSMLSFCHVDFIKINEKEFCESFEIPFGQKDEILKNEIVCVSKKIDVAIVVTRGKKSTMAVKDGKYVEIPTENLEKIVNTTACGDSFNAGFLHAFVNGSSFENALAKGTWCAARNAQNERPGAILN